MRGIIQVVHVCEKAWQKRYGNWQTNLRDDGFLGRGDDGALDVLRVVHVRDPGPIRILAVLPGFQAGQLDLFAGQAGQGVLQELVRALLTLQLDCALHAPVQDVLAQAIGSLEPER